MIDRGVSDEAQAIFAEPLPEDNILVHDRGLELRFGGKVEDLNRPRLGFERNDLSGPVHDRTVRVDRSLNDFIVVSEVDNYDLRFVLFIKLLSNADEAIGF